LTTVKLHTIFYVYTSLLDIYYEKELCNFKQDMTLQDNVFPFGR